LREIILEDRLTYRQYQFQFAQLLSLSSGIHIAEAVYQSVAKGGVCIEV